MVVDGRLRAPAWLGLLLMAAGTIFAFPVTLDAARDLANTTTISGLVALAPIAFVATIVLAIARNGPPEQPKLEPAMLAAIPLMLAATILAVFGPARMGFTYWYLRLDLVALSLFALALCVCVVGVRTIMQARAVPVVGLLCLPPVLYPALMALANGLTAATQTIAIWMSEAFPLGANHIRDGRFQLAGGGTVDVASVCGGIEGVAFIAMLAGPVLAGTRGPWQRKAWIVGGSALAAWVLNAARVVLLLSIAGAGEMTWFRRVHEAGGAATIAIVVVGVLAATRLAGLTWRFGGLMTQISYSRNHVVALALLLTIGTGAANAAQHAQARDGIPTSSVDGRVAVQMASAPDTDPRRTGGITQVMHLSVPGYLVRRDTDMPWFREFFGRETNAASFAMVRLAGGQNMWAQVVVSPSRRKVEQFGPVECFVAHGARIYRVRQVPLPGGAATMIDQRQRGVSFSALTWTQPVRMPDGRAGYRRMVLFSLARRGTPEPLSNGSRGVLEHTAFGVVNFFSPFGTNMPDNQDFAPAERELQRFATALVKAGA